jgi:hypothetical protein
MYQGNIENKMSIGWIYSGLCCPDCVNPGRWRSRRRHGNRSKRHTLRTFRLGSAR